MILKPASSESQNLSWIPSVPPAVAGGCMRSDLSKSNASTSYPPATAGGTDSVQL